MPLTSDSLEDEESAVVDQALYEIIILPNGKRVPVKREHLQYALANLTIAEKFAVMFGEHNLALNLSTALPLQSLILGIETYLSIDKLRNNYQILNNSDALKQYIMRHAYNHNNTDDAMNAVRAANNGFSLETAKEVMQPMLALSVALAAFSIFFPPLLLGAAACYATAILSGTGAFLYTKEKFANQLQAFNLLDTIKTIFNNSALESLQAYTLNPAEQALNTMANNVGFFVKSASIVGAIMVHLLGSAVAVALSPVYIITNVLNVVKQCYSFIQERERFNQPEYWKAYRNNWQQKYQAQHPQATSMMADTSFKKHLTGIFSDKLNSATISTICIVGLALSVTLPLVGPLAVLGIGAIVGISAACAAAAGAISAFISRKIAKHTAKQLINKHKKGQVTIENTPTPKQTENGYTGPKKAVHATAENQLFFAAEPPAATIEQQLTSSASATDFTADTPPTTNSNGEISGGKVPVHNMRKHL
jgi:hypothetical protein